MSESQAPSPTRNWTWWIGTVAALVLGGELVFSAFAKAIDVPAFADVITRLGFVPVSLTTLLAYAVVAFEAVLGVGLITNSRTKPVLLATTGTFVFFTLIIARQFLLPESERDANCGCKGILVVRTPGEALVENLIFVALSGLAWVGRSTWRRTALAWVRIALAALAGVGVTAFAIVAPDLPLDDLATTLRVEATAADTKLDTVIPELQDGRVLLVLIDRDREDDETKAAVDRLNKLFYQDESAARLFGLASDQPGLASKFLWTVGPAFEFREVKSETLRSYYRKLPRAALFDRGKIVRVWNEIPSDEVLDALARGELG